MNERDDQSIDHELSGIAMAATHEHEQTVSAGETEAALGAVRSRIAAGDLGGAPPSIGAPVPAGNQRSLWVRIGAVAAVVAMVALGLVAVVGDGRTNDVITPATVPDIDPAPTDPPVTDVPTTELDEQSSTSVPETDPTVPSTTATPASVVRAIAVDASDPPPLLQPEPYFTLPLAPNPDGGGIIQFAVGVDHVVVNQPNTGTITIVGPDVDGITAREVAVEENVGAIASGPGPVVYGLGDPVFDDGDQAAPRGFRFVAIPFLGENEGSVVASSEVDLNAYLEIPPSFFGHGADGIIARGRDGATVIGYVDENGQPRGSGETAENGTPFPVFDLGDDVAGDDVADENTIAVRGTDISWQLDITRDPQWGGFPFAGRNVVAAGSQRAIYVERIGADTDPDQDFASNAMPVVALLNYDGSGEWVRLPDDWDVVASDVWGTLLARITDDSIELASLDDLVPPTGPPLPSDPQPDTESATTTPDTTATTTVAPTVAPDPGNDLVQPTAVVRTCAGISTGCTQLQLTETGRIVGFDEVDDTFRIYDEQGTELQAEVELAESVEDLNPFFVAVGPDDVAYLAIDDPEVLDPVGRLVAVPLVGANAGTVVMEWSGLGRSGDSTLISRKAGLTVVGCCGGFGTRPTPDATIYRWVDRDGQTIESSAPSFDLNLGRDANSLTRIDTAADGSPVFTPLPLPTAFANPRDFPEVAATDDGAALAYDFVQTRSGGVEVFVDFDTDWSQTNVDNGNVFYRAIGDDVGVGLLEPTGTVIVAEGPNTGRWVRRDLGEIATRGWPGRTESDVGQSAFTAPGLNEWIEAEQPFWADAPELFAWQFATSLRDHESTRVEFDAAAQAPVITITEAGFLDDSVAAVRSVITTSRGDDGLLRFVSGESTFQCQPGRGHQDFSTELCT